MPCWEVGGGGGDWEGGGGTSLQHIAMCDGVVSLSTRSCLYSTQVIKGMFGSMCILQYPLISLSHTGVSPCSTSTHVLHLTQSNIDLASDLQTLAV